MSQQVPSDKVVTIETLKQMMKEFVRERDWEKYHTPKNLAASVSVEAAELLELFQWLTPEESTTWPINDLRFRQAVGEELADVLMYLISLANTLGLDVAQTVTAKMAKNRSKYPPEKFQGHYQRPLD
jgi:NTP pyrophosphatase (non-canonical NTP hydrolase)